MIITKYCEVDGQKFKKYNSKNIEKNKKAKDIDIKKYINKKRQKYE